MAAREDGASRTDGRPSDPPGRRGPSAASSVRPSAIGRRLGGDVAEALRRAGLSYSGGAARDDIGVPALRVPPHG